MSDFCKARRACLTEKKKLNCVKFMHLQNILFLNDGRYNAESLGFSDAEINVTTSKCSGRHYRGFWYKMDSIPL